MNEAMKMTEFGADVLGAEAIKEYLPKDTAKKLQGTIEKGVPLDPSIAGEVAHAMKHWAMDRGATHYTHWFLPLTGATAEKHDSFLELKDGEPAAAEQFARALAAVYGLKPEGRSKFRRALSLYEGA